MSFLDADPSKPKKELFNDILDAAVNQSQRPGLPLLPFGALLVKISEEASETITDLKIHITKLNEENAKLQWWVVVLAVTAYVYPPTTTQLSPPSALSLYPTSAVAPTPLSTSSLKVVSTPSASVSVSAKK